MNEAIRIFSNRNRRIALICIPLVLWIPFFYGKSNGDFSALLRDSASYRAELASVQDDAPEEILRELAGRPELTSDAWKLQQQARHLSEYPGYLAGVQKQAAQLQKSGIFQMETDSYAYRNILKTAEDFAGCSADDVRLGNDRAVNDWLSFSLADWGYLAAVLLLVMGFLEERKKGLSAIIRSCPGGRARLQLSRISILLGFCALMTVLIYMVPLGISFLLDGGIRELDRPIQSMALFGRSTAAYSISDFLIVLSLVRVLCGFFLGMLLWFLLSFVQQIQLSWILTAMLFAGEYLLFRFIPAQSVFSMLGSVNVFSYAFPLRLYTDYRNLNLMGYPVSERTFLIGLSIAGSVLLSAATVVLLSRRYPFGNRDLLGKWMLRWNRLGDFLRRPLGLFGMEWYKLLFLSTGGLFLLLSIWLSGAVRCDSGAYNRIDDWIYRQYVAEIQGPVSEDTRAYLESARQSLTESPLDSQDYLLALDRLEQRLTQLQDGEWLVDETAFMNLYGPKAWRLQRRNGLLAIVALCACLSPLFAPEQNGDIRKVVRSTPNGRQKLFRVKGAVAVGVTLLVWALFFGQEWHLAAQRLGPFLLSAPIGSIPMLQNGSMTVGSFMAVLYASKAALLLIPMCLCVFLGTFSTSFSKCFLLETAVLLIPAAAYHFGADIGILTPLGLMADQTILLTDSGVAPIACWYVLASLAAVAAMKKWCDL